MVRARTQVGGVDPGSRYNFYLLSPTPSITTFLKEQVNSIMGKSQWLQREGVIARRAGHRESHHEQTRLSAGPEVMALTRPMVQAGAVPEGKPWHMELCDWG